MVEQGVVDQDYVDNHAYGWPELKARAAEFTLEYVEKVTGVKAADIAKFAREFATSQPSAIRIGVAIERSAGGAQAARAVYAIPAVAGSWRHVGGGMLQLPLWDFPVDWVKAARPDWIKPGTRVVNNLRLGQALTGEMKLDPPIKSLFVFCTNPVSQSPETNKIVEGLKREDLFTVVAEHFITDTAKYADIILPSAMAGEAEDMMWSWGHFYFTYNQKAVDPPGECKPTSEMWRLLGRGDGLRRSRLQNDRQRAMRRIHQLGRPQDGRRRHGVLQGARLLQDRRRLRRHAHAARRGQVPDAVRQGRAAFERRQELRRRAVPRHVRGRAGWITRSIRCRATYRCASLPKPIPTSPRLYPLNIISPKSHGFLNSCYANEPHKIKGQGEQFVMISRSTPRSATSARAIRCACSTPAATSRAWRA